jgi:hypothetical protein
MTANGKYEPRKTTIAIKSLNCIVGLLGSFKIGGQYLGFDRSGGVTAETVFLPVTEPWARP